MFNTALTGYQEILTDPSYAGQIITFTNPHIGNYGVNATDFESRRLFCRGVVVRELARRPSNRNSQGDLDSMLRRYGIPGIAGIDTRRLTRVIRDTGAIPGAIGPGRRRRRGARRRRRPSPAPTASTSSPRSRRPSRTRSGQDGDVHDRRLRLRDQAHDPAPPRPLRLVSTSCRRRRAAADVLAREPGRCLPVQRSRRPGRGAVRRRGDRRASSATCRSSGSASATSCSGGRWAAETVKLPFGHHGANHPVKDLTTGHDRDHEPEPQLRRRRRLPRSRATLTHVNLNDGVCEGLAGRPTPTAFSVQHHPEAGPRAARELRTCSSGSSRVDFGDRRPAFAGADCIVDEPGLPQPDLGVA